MIFHLIILKNISKLINTMKKCGMEKILNMIWLKCLIIYEYDIIIELFPSKYYIFNY